MAWASAYAGSLRHTFLTSMYKHEATVRLAMTEKGKKKKLSLTKKRVTMQTCEVFALKWSWSATMSVSTSVKGILLIWRIRACVNIIPQSVQGWKGVAGLVVGCKMACRGNCNRGQTKATEMLGPMWNLRNKFYHLRHQFMWAGSVISFYQLMYHGRPKLTLGTVRFYAVCYN